MSAAADETLIIEPRSRDLGEFSVRRALPDRRRQRIGPFIFFDHMGPAEFPPGKGVNVRSHPHIGLATVTYLFEGEILHRDSLGFVQRIRPGAVNWMTAGRGIVHSEKVTPEILDRGQKLHGIQTWVALPIADEESDPDFTHYAADEIPDVSLEGVDICVIVGRAFGAMSPVKTASETLLAAATVSSGRTIELPEAQELGVYVITGTIDIGNVSVRAGQLAVFDGGGGERMTAASDCHIVFCGGDALAGERIIWWNFVSSNRGRLERAKDDWQNGRFDAVPGEDDFIPLPAE